MEKRDERMRRVLESALLAPSGDNCQPWRLLAHENLMRLINLPEKDTSLFNFRQRASLIAHGAFIENIALASSALGFTARLTLFPEKADPNVIAHIELNESESHEEPLYSFIPERATNRKLYKNIPLTLEQKDALQEVPESLDGVSVMLLDTADKKRRLSKVVGMNDRIVFENQQLHKFLFEQVRWTEEETVATRDGLFIKTLELPPSQQVGFKLLKNWGVVRMLNTVGLSRFIGKQAERLCLSASALGLIVAEGNSPAHYMNGGRLFQRVWLESARAGLSFQPMTGIVFLMQRVKEGEVSMLTPHHIHLIREAEETIRELFHLDAETGLLLFRVGFSDPPSAVSLRLPVDRVVETF